MTRAVYAKRLKRIYAIKFHGKVIYVGQTGETVDTRYFKHLNCAKQGIKGGSRIPKLYDHFRANNCMGYTFELLELVEKDNREVREKYWIAHFNTKEDGCNTTAGGLTARGREHYSTFKFKCVETDEIFHTLEEAAERFSISKAAVCLAIKGKLKTAAGKTFVKI